MAANFEITNVTPTRRADANGAFVNVQTVTFVTKPSGLGGTVDVPDTAFSPDEVARVVDAKALLLESVKNL